MPEEKKTLGEKAEHAGAVVVTGVKTGAKKAGEAVQGFGEGVKNEMKEGKPIEEKVGDAKKSVVKGLKKEIKKIKKQLKKDKKKNKKNKKDKKKSKKNKKK
jgi:hypothetical protein